MAPANLTLTLHIDKSSKEVRFAVASKDVVDFLFNLLLLPLGTVVSLLATEDQVGCLDKLYESMKNFTSWRSTKDKDALLKPSFLVSSAVISTILGRQSSNSSFPGFVNSGTYKVTDNLFIQPMSANVKDDVLCETREVNLGLNECKKLLRAFLRAEPVLSSIFQEDIMTETPPQKPKEGPSAPVRPPWGR